MINHYKGHVAVSENDAAAIRKINKSRQTNERLHKWQLRREIERLQEDIALEHEINYLH